MGGWFKGTNRAEPLAPEPVLEIALQHCPSGGHGDERARSRVGGICFPRHHITVRRVALVPWRTPLCLLDACRGRSAVPTQADESVQECRTTPLLMGHHPTTLVNQSQPGRRCCRCLLELPEGILGGRQARDSTQDPDLGRGRGLTSGELVSRGDVSRLLPEIAAYTL